MAESKTSIHPEGSSDRDKANLAIAGVMSSQSKRKRPTVARPSTVTPITDARLLFGVEEHDTPIFNWVLRNSPRAVGSYIADMLTRNKG